MSKNIKKQEVVQHDELDERVEGVNWIVVGPLLAIMAICVVVAYIWVA